MCCLTHFATLARCCEIPYWSTTNVLSPICLIGSIQDSVGLCWLLPESQYLKTSLQLDCDEHNTYILSKGITNSKTISLQKLLENDFVFVSSSVTLCLTGFCFSYHCYWYVETGDLTPKIQVCLCWLKNTYPCLRRSVFSKLDFRFV